MIDKEIIQKIQEWKEYLRPYFTRLQRLAMKDENIATIGMEENYRNDREFGAYGDVIVNIILSGDIAERNACLFHFYTGNLEEMSRQNLPLLMKATDLLEEGKYTEALTLSKTAL